MNITDVGNIASLTLKECEDRDFIRNLLWECSNRGIVLNENHLLQVVGDYLN